MHYKVTFFGGSKDKEQMTSYRRLEDRMITSNGDEYILVTCWSCNSPNERTYRYLFVNKGAQHEQTM